MKVDINVPDSLNEIKLEQYQKFQKLNTKENQESSFLLQKMVELFCNLDLKDVANIKYKSVQEIILHLNKVFEEKNELTPTFTLGGIDFGFIPVLDDMTLGEYIDLDTYLGDWDNMHKAINVLYRPIKVQKKNKYNIEEYGIENYSDLLKNTPLNIVMGCLVFFWSLNSELLTITLNYLTQAEGEMTMEQRQTLETNGVGINQSMDLLKKMLPDLIALPN